MAILPFYINLPTFGRFIFIMSQVKTQLKISARHRMYRRKRGLSQKAAAQKMGLKAPSNLSRWEKGVLIPSPENIGKLLLMYNTTFEELYCDLMQDLKENYPNLTNGTYMVSTNSSAP